MRTGTKSSFFRDLAMLTAAPEDAALRERMEREHEGFDAAAYFRWLDGSSADERSDALS